MAELRNPYVNKKLAEPLVEQAYIHGLTFTDPNIKSITKIATGKYRVTLQDKFIGKNLDVQLQTAGFGVARLTGVNTATASFEVWYIHTYNRTYSDLTPMCYFKVYERKN
jgi:hypothetical protein